MPTRECHSDGGLNSSSGCELKLYLKWKRNTIFQFSEKSHENNENLVGGALPPFYGLSYTQSLICVFVFTWIKSFWRVTSLSGKEFVSIACAHNKHKYNRITEWWFKVSPPDKSMFSYFARNQNTFYDTGRTEIFRWIEHFFVIPLVFPSVFFRKSISTTALQNEHSLCQGKFV